jgi:hypothetical protein
MLNQQQKKLLLFQVFILLESTIIPEIVSIGTNIIAKNIDIEPLFFKKSHFFVSPL